MGSFSRAFFGATFATVALVSSAAAGPGAIAVGDVAPDFGGAWRNHASTALADLRGRVVLVECMRTW